MQQPRPWKEEELCFCDSWSDLAQSETILVVTGYHDQCCVGMATEVYPYMPVGT